MLWCNYYTLSTLKRGSNKCHWKVKTRWFRGGPGIYQRSCSRRPKSRGIWFLRSRSFSPRVLCSAHRWEKWDSLERRVILFQSGSRGDCLVSQKRRAIAMVWLAANASSIFHRHTSGRDFPRRRYSPRVSCMPRHTFMHAGGKAAAYAKWKRRVYLCDVTSRESKQVQ